MGDMVGQPLVIDTNIALDLLVFHDPGTGALRDGLSGGMLRWVATDAMREELSRVLNYPQISSRLQAKAEAAEQVLLRWDAMVQRVPEPSRAAFRCKDGDDQKFIDLAVAHQALLLSKDKAVLAMARRLARVGALVSRTWVTGQR